MSSCAICLELEMKEPAACIPCGHTFCYRCITQWTRTHRHFSLSLCPQCRAPVKQVQKLFISEWPVSTVGDSISSPQSPWQHLVSWVMFLPHIVAVRFQTAAHHLPGWLETLHQNAQGASLHLLAWKDSLRHSIGQCWQTWCDLDYGPQLLVVSALAVLLLLFIEDLSQKDGLHRGIVFPIVSLLIHASQQLVCLVAYLLYRPVMCCLACLMEVAWAIIDMLEMATTSALWVVIDVLSLPWLVLGTVLRLLHKILTICLGLLCIGLACLLLALPFASRTVANLLLASLHHFLGWLEMLQDQYLPGEELTEASNMPGEELAEASNMPGVVLTEASNMPGEELAEANNMPGVELAEASNMPGEELAEASNMLLDVDNPQSLQEAESQINISHSGTDSGTLVADPLLVEYDRLLQRASVVYRGLQHALVYPRHVPIVTIVIDIMQRLISPTHENPARGLVHDHVPVNGNIQPEDRVRLHVIEDQTQ